ncbi:hypothetical protein POM88_033821 [Heracleum sosnowskyi]|uniref:Reverse transcriptase n=1 Tax=Heracleum sosnowskyi TaxID=360622 RepID=A0AAD8MCH8_9APIA|nr:hypothetical protein POM88_033821 [Heracleum sosnowskyi]
MLAQQVSANAHENIIPLKDIIRNIRNVGKWWNKNILGNLDLAITNAEDELEKRDANNSLDAHQAVKHLDELYHHRDQILWQKSRVNWNAGGDKNSKKIHQIVNHRRHKSNIIGLFHDNIWQTQPQVVKQILFDHFNMFLNKNTYSPSFKIGTLFTNKIPDNIKSLLERPFSIEETQLALRDSNSNKSPGLDGLNAIMGIFFLNA